MSRCFGNGCAELLRRPPSHFWDQRMRLGDTEALLSASGSQMKCKSVHFHLVTRVGEAICSNFVTYQHALFRQNRRNTDATFTYSWSKTLQSVRVEFVLLSRVRGSTLSLCGCLSNSLVSVCDYWMAACRRENEQMLHKVDQGLFGRLKRGKELFALPKTQPLVF